MHNPEQLITDEELAADLAALAVEAMYGLLWTQIKMDSSVQAIR